MIHDLPSGSDPMTAWWRLSSARSNQRVAARADAGMAVRLLAEQDGVAVAPGGFTLRRGWRLQ
ncbi:hypothetical protein UO65_2610 [Actinokineospora spheciospongiae]|uniref:Uncharacterized protein n=1 Tax=Actinokineospora spheciospongiae TaxID=909613 RepID=W7IZV9_9PSEU|nr:hypothetical protein UO65_2610 [Actinokineospora spheciospongiae]